MSKADQKRVPRGGLTRRAVLAGVGGAAGLAAGLQASSSRAETTMALDLDDPEDNLKALIKLQADLSGKDVIGGPGSQGSATRYCSRATGSVRATWSKSMTAGVSTTVSCCITWTRSVAK